MARTEEMVVIDAQIYWNTNIAGGPNNRRVIHNGMV